MSVKSAKNGSVAWGVGDTLVADVTDISITFDGDPKVYASSSTAGNRSRVAGHKDAEGSFTVKNDAVPGGLDEGTTVELLIKSDTGVTLFDGSGLIGSISYSVPIESGEIVEATIAWGQVYVP